MEDTGIPLARITRILVALLMGALGLWAYLNKKGKEEEAARKQKQVEDEKAAQAAAAELKRQREEGFHE